MTNKRIAMPLIASGRKNVTKDAPVRMTNSQKTTM
jgi:hypothetical protein